MKKTAIAAALFLVAGAAQAAPLATLTITGGTFSMNSGNINPMTVGSFADMTVGDYDGSAPTSADFGATSIATFSFDTFGNVAVYTSASDDINTGFAAPTGDITDGVATLELDSWTAWWNGSVFNQGSTSTKGATDTCATGADFVTRCSTAVVIDSYDAVTGDFTASWDSVVVGGSFNGGLGNWTISGNMSAVPVPAAVWLFGSGLLGLAGIARRRKAA